MDIKSPLTKQEFVIYESIKDIKTVLTSKDLQTVFPEYTSQRINEIMSGLHHKHYLIQLEKSKYILNISYTNEDLFKIAFLIHPGYIGFSTALYSYGLLEYEPFTIFIINVKISKEYSIGNYTLKFVNLKDNLLNYFQNKEGIFVSSLEKTIFDCFYKPEYAGGHQVISKAIFDSYKKIDWDKLITIYKKYASSRQHQITGYILDLLIETTNIKIPKKVEKYFLTQVKSKTYLLNNSTKTINYSSKWKLKDNFGKKNILDWWY